MKTAILTLLLMGCAFAYIPIDKQVEILRSARNADIQNYFAFSGVVLYDEPQISPFFACVRAYVYRNYPVNGTLMVDRVSCLQNSYYKQAWHGIQVCNNGSSIGKLWIDASLGYRVIYSC